ncbi:hypothetical protein ABB37_07998 [Leptomonas pyrrhocoris]|uniref:Uncharacterized protein n=1 Tax=Leptomonas pyrrhocoris TaxID=157538 RepID=A0A0M9FUQ2_LEPPY|nr:hypothetical protein ABB37_07998 [Leptomonas pyrrhocoris]XP_015654696.1 hypothetical protein ABB37_07998 [Leptomonas pyrrhocoris]KPA76256.1 hypothetical protein ABB37_07998 [Leptomonas pyrrhocoris]KPA76257.1 hypothetical protein ABB37_07998 [Leptomonas pyrrhocoris]|eukprot:XP_015654695.1 hypothetical protein ABB37_07998 [Leptomonas pyrrhocoris]
MDPTSNDYASPPSSPVERDLTAVMMADEDPSTPHNSTVTTTAAAAAGAVDLPHNVSSWELLDITAASFTAQNGGGFGLTALPIRGERRDSNADETPAAAMAHSSTREDDAPAHVDATTGAPSVPPPHDALREGASDVYDAFPTAESGCVSPANSTLSGWSLISIPSEAHFNLGVAAPASQTQPPCTAADADATNTDCKGRTHKMGHEGGAADPLVADRVVSQALFIASPLLSPVPLAHEIASVAAAVGSRGREGWSTTSYEEVCMSDACKSGGQTTRAVSSIVSACTTPSPLHSAAFLAEVSTLCPPGGALPEEEGAGEAMAASRPSHHELARAQWTTWMCREVEGDGTVHEGVEQLSGLPPSSPTASTDASKTASSRTATWSARRLSFLSASTATVSFTAAFIPRTSLTGFTGATASLFHANGEATVHDTPPPPPSSASSSTASSSPFLSVLVGDAAQWWSWTRVACADGPQRALRGLHQVCDYIWMDLKEHWYPQLRLVLGDHSCAAKVHRTYRGRRRVSHRKADKKAATLSGHASHRLDDGVEPKEWRSVSAPCLVSGQVYPSHESKRAAAAVSEKWKDLHSETGKGCGHASRSTRHGLQLCFAVTADAVASAAQGLCVFLL